MNQLNCCCVCCTDFPVSNICSLLIANTERVCKICLGPFETHAIFINWVEELSDRTTLGDLPPKFIKAIENIRNKRVDDAKNKRRL